MILFILKKNAGYGCYHGATGLHNSAKFVVDMFLDAGVDAALAEAIDNNCIDRLVAEYQPDTVIIEALWVVPEKFDVLMPLHPDVTWIVRNHSKFEFLANEGNPQALRSIGTLPAVMIISAIKQNKRINISIVETDKTEKTP